MVVTNKLYDIQKFIIHDLHTRPLCTQLKNDTDINNISISTINKILTNNYTNGSDMKAMMCFFNTLLTSTKQTDSIKGLPTLTNKIQNILTNTKRLSSGVQGYVFTSDLLGYKDLRLIIKVPKNPDERTNINMLMEYYIGMRCMNNLRFEIPTFIYTFGGFTCDKDGLDPHKQLCSRPIQSSTNNNDMTHYVLYEEIDGIPFTDLIRECTFTEWLDVFIQILLSLEIAQRKYNMTHFDLHPGNIMIRKNTKKYSYTVVIGNTQYTINEPKYIPVIIDYGLSTAKINGVQIGVTDMTEHGIMDKCIPCMDMYKLMVFTLGGRLNRRTSTGIRTLFSFFGNIDPYSIIADPKKGVQLSNKEFCKRVTYSLIAPFTPLMLLHYIHGRYRGTYTDLKLTPRDIYVPVQYTSSVYKYNKIFNNIDDGIQKAIAHVEKCISVKQSYIFSIYGMHILNKYIETIDTKLDPNNLYKATVLEHNIKENKDLLINSDRSFLANVFGIRIPSITETQVYFSKMRSAYLGHPVPIEYTNSNIFIYFMESIEKYMDMLYTIRELHLTDTYKEWIDLFQVSDVFMYYTTYWVDLEQTNRWYNTLIS